MAENSMFTEGQFLLGTFASNCSSGMSVTKIPERWVNSWENNLKLAKLLDEAGIDFMLPIARVGDFLESVKVPQNSCAAFSRRHECPSIYYLCLCNGTSLTNRLLIFMLK